MLDYADQRYYASAYGRFNTPDRKAGNGMDPGTLNRYSYVNGDPINRNDPRGLCAVMIGGITMGPTNSSAAWTTEAASLGSDSAYPYAGEGPVGSVVSVAQQAFTANDATATALSAIQYALSSNTGLVDIVAYSGGAAAFTAAYGELSSAQQARIGFVQYISPGAATQLANVQGTTSVVLGSGLVDNAATIGTQIPQGVPIQNSSCDHTDLACLFQAASPGLNLISSNGPCQNPEAFTRTGSPTTAQSVFGGDNGPVVRMPPWALPNGPTVSSDPYSLSIRQSLSRCLNEPECRM